MEAKTAKTLAIVFVLFGVLLYILAVGGLVMGAPTPPLDVGLVATTVTLLLFGAGFFWLSRTQPIA